MPLSAVDYRPRDAEHGVLYRVIDEHLETFLETARRHADGASLPEFVEREFRDFLTCGVLAYPRCGGRLRLIATVEDPGAIRAILAAIAVSRGLANRAPPFAVSLDTSPAEALSA
jgi:hypothetical protein